MAQQQIRLAIRPELPSEIRELLRNFALGLALLELLALNDENPPCFGVPGEDIHVPVVLRKALLQQLGHLDLGFSLPAKLPKTLGHRKAEFAPNLITRLARPPLHLRLELPARKIASMKVAEHIHHRI